MADPYRKVRPGERLTISARAWNRAQDAADRVLGAVGGFGGAAAQSSSAPYTWVYAKNVGGAVSRWGLMAITGFEIAPTGDGNEIATRQFQQMPVITGSNASSTATSWCVAIEPIDTGQIGRVAVAGVVQLKVSHLGNAPGASVMWKNDDWALIRIDGGVRLGTVSSSWSKGATATVTEQNGDGSAMNPTTTFSAKNYFANVTVQSGTRRVACAKVGDTWILIAAEC